MVFPKDYELVPPKKPATKRAATGGVSCAAAKKVKSELVDVDIKETAKRGNLNKLTVPILKNFCQEHKLKGKTQKKADLIDAINEHFGV